MLQSYAVQVLHDHERDVLVTANFVDHADIGMAQSGSGLGFALKTGQGMLVFGQTLGKELHGNEAMEGCVFSLVDHTHAATADFLDDTIVRDDLIDHGRERVHLRRGARASQCARFNISTFYLLKWITIQMGGKLYLSNSSSPSLCEHKLESLGRGRRDCCYRIFYICRGSNRWCWSATAGNMCRSGFARACWNKIPSTC